MRYYNSLHEGRRDAAALWRRRCRKKYCTMYVVVNGQRHDINLLEDCPPPAPRPLFALRGGDVVLETPDSMPPAVGTYQAAH